MITYANWFSEKTADFISENRESYRALRITRPLFPTTPLRFVGYTGRDDQRRLLGNHQINSLLTLMDKMIR